MPTRDRIYVIGGKEMVLGFSLLGISGYTPIRAEETEAVLRERFEDPETALILIENRTAAQIPETVDELQSRKDFPLVVEIPGPQGAVKEKSIKEFIAGAIGIRL